MHAVSIRNTISFANFWKQFDEDRNLKDPGAQEAPAAAFLDQLAWWGRAPEDARTARPHQARALRGRPGGLGGVRGRSRGLRHRPRRVRADRSNSRCP
ncbi:hypothetical protein [Streptomyces johnsoniae]|uniref:Uncharacterized protein n=1 Tax=Streptomyces johnsoniae TaxID=3075532 RepID=A0ABU2S823_9ACTN|nr:hypothetical protein [Streptomyces sp. DSM 41886]MDT0445133.1 hypothetical protein [Streptomyces sp. DSM 41886]